MTKPSKMEKMIWVAALIGFVVSTAFGVLAILDGWGAAVPFVVVGGAVAVLAGVAQIADRLTGDGR